MADRLNIQALLRRHGLKPKKSWSQNFLVDVGVLEAIVDVAVSDGSRAVIELGAGVGALTAFLAREAARVVAVERDRDLAGFLRSEFSQDPKVEILEANAASLDWNALVDRLGDRVAVVGNLPYHMATPILFHLLHSHVGLAHWVFMLQKEMADRLVAGPGSRAYGVLSVLMQMHTEARAVLEVPPHAFYPAPRVHSSVVLFKPRPTPRVVVRDPEVFEQVVRAAFQQRRKKVRNSLLSTLGPRFGKVAIDRMLELAEVDGNTRAEQLSIEVFGRLADTLSEANQ